MITSITTQKTTMKRRLISLILLSAASGPLTAQDEVAPKQIAPVEIRTKTNQGDLPYQAFYRVFGRLLALLPPAPRMIEPMLQMSFKDLRLEEQDAFLKPNWNVAIVRNHSRKSRRSRTGYPGIRLICGQRSGIATMR